MNSCINVIPEINTEGKVLYVILKNEVRKCEMHGKFNGKPTARLRWKILLIDEKSMYEPIEDAVRLVMASNLFVDKKDAEKEIFKRKLKGKNNE